MFCTCVAYLSGSVLFELFERANHFLNNFYFLMFETRNYSGVDNYSLYQKLTFINFGGPICRRIHGNAIIESAVDADQDFILFATPPFAFYTHSSGAKTLWVASIRSPMW